MKKNNILNGLYPITTSQYKSDLDFINITKDLINSDIKIIQFRPSNLSFKRRKYLIKSIHRECMDRDVKFILNNNYELLKYVDGAGLHIGSNDINLIEARKYLGKKIIIGVSCYNSIDKAIWAEKNGADYVSFGSIYHSNTKKNATTCSLDTLYNAKEKIKIPICAIGGINCYNIIEVMKKNPSMIAMISNIYDSLNPKLELNHIFEIMKYYEKIKSSI
tara:strand:+ start:43 stop:699 length:657 start_codon:yes stop_codon:yes gene_type:complete